MTEDAIKFDLTKFEDDLSSANALMSWITNRAFGFDKTRYKNICLNIEDTAEGCLANEIAFAMSTFSGVKFYTLKKNFKKCRFYSKASAIIPVSKSRYSKISHQPDTLHWNTRHTVNTPTGMIPLYAKVFFGLEHETIKFIAETLYGWDDNRKNYIKVKKQAIKAALKEAKVAIKEAKRDAKNHHNKR